MREPQLTLADLKLGLARFGDRYGALHVFADDFLEMRDTAPLPGLSAHDEERTLFRFAAPGESRDVTLLAQAGVVRLSRAARPDARATEASHPTTLGGAVAEAMIGNALSKKGQGAAAGIVLGLLVGTALGGEPQPNAQGACSR